MKKIIILITYCYLINIYNNSESIVENESNISVYALNAGYDLNENNTLYKKIVLKDQTMKKELKDLFSFYSLLLSNKDQTTKKELKDLFSLSSLLLSNMVHHDTQCYKNYILGHENKVPLIFQSGASGFLADNLFLQLHNTNYPEKLKIFATGAYDYPEFDREINNILQQPEFINSNISESSLENNDDISTYDNTTYYNPYLLDRIIPQLSKELKEKHTKNIPIESIGGIAMKLLNWIAHCHEENTFESIVFLPKKMSGVCQAIFQCLKNNSIIENGNFIYVQDTNEIKKYCKMIQNGMPIEKISINKNIELNKEKTLSLISLATIDYYYDIIKHQNKESIINSINIKSDLSHVVNKITEDNIIFNLKDTNTIMMRLLDIIEADHMEYLYYRKDKFINFLHNIIINSAFSNNTIYDDILINTKYPFILANSSPFQSSNIIDGYGKHGNYITTSNKGLFDLFFNKLINCAEISAEEKLCSLAKIAYYFCQNKTKIEIDGPLLSPTIDFILSYTEKLLHKNTAFMTYIKDLNLKLKNNEIDRLSWANRFFNKARLVTPRIIIEKHEIKKIKEIRLLVNKDMQLTNRLAKQELLHYYDLFKDAERKISIVDLAQICNLLIKYDSKHKDNTDTDDDRDELTRKLRQRDIEEEITDFRTLFFALI
jgi:hypothetical protein